MRHALRLALVVLLVAGCAQNPVKPDYYTTKLEADAAYRKGDFASALESYRLLIEKVPGEAELWFKLGNIYTRLGQPEAAVTAYREALVRDPELTKGWNNLGVVYMRQAVNAYLQLCHHAKPGDGLCERAERLVEGVNALLEPPSSSAADAPTPSPSGPAPAAAAREQASGPAPTSAGPALEPSPAEPGVAAPPLPQAPDARDLEWLARQDPDTFFVQLSSGFDSGPSLALARRFALTGERYHLFSASNSRGEVYYQLLEGPFTDYQSALAAVEALPTPLAALRPTIRRSASLQALRGLEVGEEAMP